MSIFNTISAVLNKDGTANSTAPTLIPRVKFSTIGAVLNNKPVPQTGILSKFFEPQGTKKRLQLKTKEDTSEPSPFQDAFRDILTSANMALGTLQRTTKKVGEFLLPTTENQLLKIRDDAILAKRASDKAAGIVPKQAELTAYKGTSSPVQPPPTPEEATMMAKLDIDAGVAPRKYGQNVGFGIPVGGAGGAIKRVVGGKLDEVAKKFKTSEEFVGAQGTPVYHGTGADFNDFSNIKPNFFSPDKTYASVYTNKSGGDPKIIEAVVDIKNPFDTSVNETARSFYNEQFLPYIKKFGFADDRFVPLKKGELVPFTTADDLFQFLKGEKRRGNINFDGMTVSEGGAFPNSIIPFDSSQIQTKSQLTAIWDEANKVVPPANSRPFADSHIVTTRERGFITTVKESPNASPEVKAKIAATYNPINNKDTLAGAENLIETNLDEAYRMARDIKAPATAESNAVAQLLVIKAQNAGNWNEAIDLVEITARRATTPGQAIQALAMFNRMSPEGILRFAQKTVNDVNKGLPKGKGIKLTDETAIDLVTRAKKIAKMPDGEDKVVETAQMVNKIHELIPATFLRKVATAQIFAQLLNPKTIIRNLGGNLGFSALENVKDLVAVAIDSPLSLITGKRSTALPSLGVQAKGFAQGLRLGVRDALLGIDTMGVPTQFDIPTTPVFTGTVGKGLEKTLNVVLKGPDRAFYKAAYDGSLYKQMTAAGVDEPTDAMMDIATHEGLYRTFQDANVVSKAFVGLKAVMNLGFDFGIGDIVLKYAKTPANLLVRGIEYSPAGFVNTVYQMSKPLTGKEFNQLAFVEATSRAFTGSVGLVGTGAILHRLGIISGEKEKDPDINAVQRAEGLGAYKINASALLRFAMSGLDVESAKLQKGDTLYSYDWFQPLAIGISIGANIDSASQNREGTKGTALGFAEALIEGVGSGANTIGEQPMLQNLTRIFKYGTPSDAVVAIATQIPASFVPTLLNQITQFTDNQARNTYDPNIINEALNMAKKKIPGLAQDLQPQVDVWGNPREIYQNGSNNLFNVFFNPAFKSVYKPTPESELVLGLYEDTGEKKHAPRVVAKSVKVNGVMKELGPQTLVKMQQFVGTVSRYEFHNIAKDPAFQALSDTEKINYMSALLTNIGSAAKYVVLGDRPEVGSATNPKPRNLDIRTQQILVNYYNIGPQFLETDPLVNP